MTLLFCDEWAAFLTLSSQTGPSAIVKGFGRRQAYESLRGPNPRAPDGGLWRFELGAVLEAVDRRRYADVLESGRSDLAAL